MKNKIKKIIYITRLIFFILHMLMLFMLLGNITYVGLIGYLFLIVDAIYITVVIKELMSKNIIYQKDLYYNIMQLGLFTYITVLWSKLYFNNNLYTKEFVTYLKNNYIILIVLLTFLIIYNLCLVNKKRKTFIKAN